jgi:hypothetical protein
MEKFLVYLLSIFYLNGCVPSEGPKCHKSIGVFNNSQKNIWVYDSYKNGRMIESCGTFNGYVQANTKKNNVLIQSIRSNCYEKYINGSYRGGKLDVYIFSIDPITLKDNCDTTKLKSFLLETRALTVDELQKSNWVITYPK